jgi:hypothetical protein
MNWIKIINRYNYVINKDMVNIKGNQEKLLFGFIIIKKKKIDFDICLSDVEFTQFKNMSSLCEAIEYIVNEKLNEL